MTAVHPYIAAALADDLAACRRCRVLGPDLAICTQPAGHPGPHAGRTLATRDGVSWDASPPPLGWWLDAAAEMLAAHVAALAAEAVAAEFPDDDGWSIERIDYDTAEVTVIAFDHGAGATVRRDVPTAEAAADVLAGLAE